MATQSRRRSQRVTLSDIMDSREVAHLGDQPIRRQRSPFDINISPHLESFPNPPTSPVRAPGGSNQDLSDVEGDRAPPAVTTAPAAAAPSASSIGNGTPAGSGVVAAFAPSPALSLPPPLAPGSALTQGAGLSSPLPTIRKESSLIGVARRLSTHGLRVTNRMVKNILEGFRGIPARARQWLIDISNDWMLERYQMVQLRRKMASASCYKEWAEAAVKYDMLLDKVSWTLREECSQYDFTLIRARLSGLRHLRRGFDAADMAHNIRDGLHRNIGSMCNPALYKHTHIGTKVLIQDYINEVVDQLRYLSEREFTSFPLTQRLVFFREARHAFGRTALLLSGGASMTMHHLGVVRALFEAGLLPRVISGSSGGAIVAAWVCVGTDSEMMDRLKPGAIKMDPFEQLSVGSVRRKLKRLWTRGVIFDIKVLEAFVRHNIGDITFLEAYRRTRRVLNVTVTSAVDSGGDNSRLLNYLTAPNVLIHSAVLASCAIPGVYEPVELMARNKLGEVAPYHPQGQHWQDGSLAADLPTQRLSELFNINQFIVSQTNPWVVPFLSGSDEAVSDLPWNFNGVATRIGHLIGAHIRHWAQMLCTLGLVPKAARKYMTLIFQRYTGDVTIVPAATLGDYLRLLSNPTTHYVERCINAGMRQTWKKLSFIRARCAIELALDAGVKRLQVEVAGQTVLPESPSPRPGTQAPAAQAAAPTVTIPRKDSSSSSKGTLEASDVMSIDPFSSPRRTGVRAPARASPSPLPRATGGNSLPGDAAAMRAAPSFPDFAALRSAEFSSGSLDEMVPRVGRLLNGASSGSFSIGDERDRVAEPAMTSRHTPAFEAPSLSAAGLGMPLLEEAQEGTDSETDSRLAQRYTAGASSSNALSSSWVQLSPPAQRPRGLTNATAEDIGLAILSAVHESGGFDDHSTPLSSGQRK